MNPPRTSARSRTDGPQPVEPYTYPLGEQEGTLECVWRRGRVTDNVPDANGEIEITQSDGRGFFPVETPSDSIAVQLNAQVEIGTNCRMKFRRPHGSTGAYGLERVLGRPAE